MARDGHDGVGRRTRQVLIGGKRTPGRVTGNQLEFTHLFLGPGHALLLK